jgi:Predicted membrane protein (DUF2207)
MLLSFLSAGNPAFLVFPALLLAYYLVCWALTGKDPKLENVVPEYEPPPGISPGVARYILTGGSDGTTLAAVLSQLAVKGVISIQPEAGSYRIELLQPNVAVAPEEAALVQVLFSKKMQGQSGSGTASADAGQPVPAELREAVNRIPVQQLATSGLAVAAELATEPRQITVLNPRSKVQLELALDAIQNTFRKGLKGVFFRWHFIYVFAGMVMTFLFGMLASLFYDAVFQIFWLFFFTTGAGVVIAFFRSSKPTRPTLGQRIGEIMVPFMFFVFPGLIISIKMAPGAVGLVLALLIAVSLNSGFMVLMRKPTPAGQLVLQRLAGLREFLLRVEQDRLERINSPEDKARLMNRFLPYAIALGVKEGWGDTMAAAFSNAIVER